MKSIRRSLVFYFLGLMAIALGAVGFLIDRMAGQTLAARAAAVHQMIDLRYDEAEDEERRRFDAELTAMARALTNEVQTQYYQQGQREFRDYWQMMQLAPLGSLGAGAVPYPVAVPLWLSIGDFRQRNPSVGRLHETFARSHFSKLHLDELPGLEDQTTDYAHVMVEAVPNRVFRTRNLETEKWAASAPAFDAAKPFEEKFENRVLSNGQVVRVVEMKAPISVVLRLQGTRSPVIPTFGGRFAGSGRGEFRSDSPLRSEPSPPRAESPPRSESSPRSEPSPPRAESPTRSESSPRSEPSPPPEQPPQPVPFRTAYIQYGRAIEPLNARLALLNQRRQEEKAAEITRVQAERRGLRAWLALIGILTFAGLFGGGLMLVKRGLRPLDTLSDAVARVSEKDFYLPVKQEQLSEELVPIHARLTATLDQLKRAFEHDKQAVADISHELRTPVAALLATLDVCLRKPRDTEHYRQTLQECRNITKQLQGLVEKVMLLASLDTAPRDGLATSLIDLTELAENCAAVIRPLAAEQGLTVRVNTPGPVMLQTDADKLREVLMNLLHNAVEYNRPGGTIDLQVSNGQGRAKISVRDNGIGMTEEVKARIFERFYRADPSRTATGIHAGLGLAIVKECVDRLGGTIKVQSTPNQGSEFTVDIPA